MRTESKKLDEESKILLVDPVRLRLVEVLKLLDERAHLVPREGLAA